SVISRSACTHYARVQLRTIRSRYIGEPHNPALSRPLPRAGKAHAPDVKDTVGVDPDGGTEVDRTAVENPAANEPARRVAVAQAEQIAVHSCDSCFRGRTLLHRRHAFATEDRVVRKDRLQRVETRRLRDGDHVDHDRTMSRELDLSRIDHAGQKRLSSDRHYRE